MTTQNIADRVVELNRLGEYGAIYGELYSPDVLSVENWSGETVEYMGLEAVKKKAADWNENVSEIHEMRVSDPLVADESFAVTFYLDATFKDSGRQAMTELAVYTTKDNQIVREEFRL